MCLIFWSLTVKCVFVIIYKIVMIVYKLNCIFIPPVARLGSIIESLEYHCLRYLSLTFRCVGQASGPVSGDFCHEFPSSGFQSQTVKRLSNICTSAHCIRLLDDRLYSAIFYLNSGRKIRLYRRMSCRVMCISRLSKLRGKSRLHLCIGIPCRTGCLAAECKLTRANTWHRRRLRRTMTNSTRQQAATFRLYLHRYIQAMG